MVKSANDKSPQTTSVLPLDRKKLRSITGEKSSLQDELLEIFFFNVAECLSAMEHHCKSGMDDKWDYATDELKNISQSIGAVELAKICEKYQRMSATTSEEKKQFLANIRANVQTLRAFVRNTRY